MPHTLDDIGLEDVRSEYAAVGSDIAELIMGELVHIGGLHASRDLADRAGIEPGTVGVDLCCYTGASMCLLVRLRNVAQMIGVDATAEVIERGRRRCMEEGLADRISFVLGDACETGLPDASMDFVWGEDAWCYVTNKAGLIREAARIVRPGGTIAFTDWIEGPTSMTVTEAKRLMRFMRFPSILDLPSYEALLRQAKCWVEVAEDTGRFAPYADLYRKMITMQLTYDALRAAGYDEQRLETLEREREFVRELAEAGKLIQGILIARKG